ncbi:MAG: polyphenol oxidase family protein, partial [Bdellovibrionales bacterium]|nr:polyphenol oxidase family protein [Bdellovibrionales bacterium]
FTFEKNLALLIKTADCLPVILVSNSHTAPIIALHAGWRGVVERIIPKAIELFPKERFTGYIGPHIQFENFEVGKDVATQISNSCPNATKISKSHIDPNKLYINLARVAELQMESNGSRCGYTSSIDTLTNLNYPSYRRDAKKERMWTFVAKI